MKLKLIDEESGLEININDVDSKSRYIIAVNTISLDSKSINTFLDSLEYSLSKLGLKNYVIVPHCDKVGEVKVIKIPE